MSLSGYLSDPEEYKRRRQNSNLNVRLTRTMTPYANSATSVPATTPEIAPPSPYFADLEQELAREDRFWNEASTKNAESGGTSDWKPYQDPSDPNYDPFDQRNWDPNAFETKYNLWVQGGRIGPKPINPAAPTGPPDTISDPVGPII